jgi:pimeloyl-ACP methyl ester carboxylesterase
VEIAGSLLVLAAAGLLWAVIGSTRVLYPIRLHLPVRPSDFGIAVEPLQFQSADGTSISGWLVRRPQASGLLLMLHGFGSSKDELLDLAGALHRNSSFNLLLIDFRGHGHSGPGPVTFGFREVGEVKAALDLAQADPQLQDLPIGCWGISMGGAIALLAAARYPQIRGVVADGAYSDVGKAIARAQWLTYHIPRFPLGQLVIWAVEARLRCRTMRMDPLRVISRIRPRVIFLIHGGRDKSIPPREGEALHRAAGEPKRWWLIPESEHATCYYDRTEEYVQRVTEFFNDAFLRAA